jgi:tetratricopeptide (TPR) repeat protein/DNA-directed RNA polymerase subunit M/transcription elongation factor TFIIS
MPIKFACPNCQKMLQVKDHLAGKKGPCPACKKVITVPAQSQAAAARARSELDLEELATAALAEPKAAPQVPTTVDFTCPYCDAEVHLSAELAGKNTPCPECRRIIKVPLLEKTGPRDWRRPETQVGPSGARRPDAELEGAWGTQTTRRSASQEALLEAGAIREAREPVTVAQWVKRGAALAVFLAAAGVGFLWWQSLRRGWLETGAVELAASYLPVTPREQQALGAASAERHRRAKLLTPSQHAELLRLLGEYYQRTDQIDPQERSGVQFLQLTRLLARPDSGLEGRITDDFERQAVLLDLLATQTALDLSAEELGGTLQLLPPGPARDDAVRTMVRQLLAAGATDPARRTAHAAKARQVIERGTAVLLPEPPKPPDQPEKPSPDDPNKPPPVTPESKPPEPDESELLNSLGILGQELIRAGQADQARQLAEELRARYRPQYAFPAQYQVLLVMLKLPPLDTKDEETALLAQVEALARAGDVDAARRVLDDRLTNPRRYESRLRALLTLAEVLIEKGQTDEALRRLSEAVAVMEPYAQHTTWERLRAVELTAAAGNLDEAARRAAGLLARPEQAPAQARARLAVLRAALQSSPDQPVDPARLGGLTPQHAAYGVAVALLARHNARIDARATKRWAETLDPEAGRPFAAVGVVLGVRDQR